MAKMNPEEYDLEPVVYCKECISLRILRVQDQDYCDECGCTDIASGSIYDWAEEYSKNYGEDKILKHKSIFKAD